MSTAVVGSSSHSLRPRRVNIGGGGGGGVGAVGFDEKKSAAPGTTDSSECRGTSLLNALGILHPELGDSPNLTAVPTAVVDETDDHLSPIAALHEADTNTTHGATTNAIAIANGAVPANIAAPVDAVAVGGGGGGGAAAAGGGGGGGARTFKAYSLEEVSKHTTKSDCWLAISGKVYRVDESWFKHHPGGEMILLNLAGQDVTDPFIVFHPHTVSQKLLPAFQIGVVEGWAPTAMQREFHEMRVKLEHEGLFNTDFMFYVKKLLVQLVLIGLAGLLLLLTRTYTLLGRCMFRP